VKSKIQTPQRVRIPWGNANGVATIYVSSWVATQVRPLCMTINMIMFPRKGKSEELTALLQGLAQEHPEQFMAGSRNLLAPPTYTQRYGAF
jgi:hypothetical protein